MTRTFVSNTPELKIGKRRIGQRHPPFVIAEIGINHEGSLEKAIQMVDDARASGCECVKFQCHVLDDEMVPNNVIPGNATETIWEIISRCALDKEQEISIKKYVEQHQMIYLSTPFSRAAADRLESMGVLAYKIGSGECNNYPLISHIATYGKPIILSTGMNNIASIRPAVSELDRHGINYALLHCTSIYPTPHELVHLGALDDLAKEFPDAVIGLSDHSIGNYTCFAAIALGGGAILEKHFTSDKNWDGPDINLSIDAFQLADLVSGSRAVFSALGGQKEILGEEQPTIDFAYACVVSIMPIKKGESINRQNTWVKRPGNGEIMAKDYENILGLKATEDIPMNCQIKWSMLDG